MKIKYLAIGILATAMLYSCGGGATEPTTETVEATPAVEAVVYTVDKEASQVAWKGEVAGVYGHNGVISISEGTISIADGAIAAGSFIIDMKTITPTDSGYKDKDGNRASDLVAHLSTGDFFLVDSFPTASFVVKSFADNKLTGDLTVRGTTKEEVIEVSSIVVSDTEVNAVGKLVFNRQDYGVSWKHYMKDMVLSNDIAIDITLKATK